MSLLLAAGLVACKREDSHEVRPLEDSSIPVIIKPMLSLAAPGFEGKTIQTLCLKVDRYEPTQGARRIDLAGFLGQVLGFAGVTVVHEGAPCDATLSVTLSVQAATAKYGGELGPSRYTSAVAKGTLALSMGALKPHLVQVDHSVSPKRFIGTDSYQKPEEAPIEEATRVAMLEGVVSTWGTDLLVRFIQYEDTAHLFHRGIISSDYLHVFESLKPEQKVELLPDLIQLLSDHDAGGVSLHHFLLGIGKPAVPALVTVLQGKDDYATEAALNVLRWMKGDALEAVPALLGILRGGSQTHRKHAAEVLVEIYADQSEFGWPDEDPPPRSEDADRWQQWIERYKRNQSAIGRLGASRLPADVCE